MKFIGMIVAVEIQSVLNKYETSNILEYAGFKIYEYKLNNKTLFVIHSGAGEILATMATQILISKFNVEFIVNFGVVGGLTDEMKLSKTCIVKSVVHYDFDTSNADNNPIGKYLEYDDIYIPTTKEIINKVLIIEPTLKPVICASGDKFIADEKKKRELHQKFNADICEMEAAGIVLTCNKNDIPCLLIKTISDSISGGAKEFFDTVNKSANTCLDITHQLLNTL